MGARDHLGVGLTIDKQAATIKFGQALVLARSDMALPDEWMERTREIARAQNKTFTPVLGTALLAKSTERFVDAFSLREGESHKSYSARSLAKEVLVPCCVRAGIDIRNKGAEPLNNQPFLRAPRITPDLNVKPKAVPELRYLCECLERADFLEGQSALEALAAFLRARISFSEGPPIVALGASVLTLPELVSAVDSFMLGDPEGGKVGQALATAAFDLAFSEVKTKRINDPSSKWPGDVGVFERGAQTLSAEVKQRAVTDAEVLLFAKRLHESGLHRGVVIALAQDRHPLDLEELRFQAHRLSQVELVFFLSAGALVRAACAAALADLPMTLAKFPRNVLTRMLELEVSEARMREWALLFGG